MSPQHTAQPLPEVFAHFDRLPNSAHVRQPIVELLFACSSSTIWRRVRDGHIPRPHKLSARVTAWRVGDLRQILK
ncbi:helix-turn-helix transcriptional regulator [Nitrospira japonica]|uniref:helix-turn-helix transcriptional regulator n=1 Tax=Nitrospira japonica TaxID=1325564 RepID=UPI0009B93A7B